MNENYNNMNNDMNQNNNNQKGGILGIIFLIWFFASIIALCYFNEKNQLLSVVILGQYFLVFGLVAFSASKNLKGFGRYFPLIFAVVGLVCIIIPFLMANPDLLSFTIIWDNVIPALMLLVFILVGLGLIFIPIISRNKKLKRTTYRVIATVKEHKESISDSTNVYCPVYEFYYNGQFYLVGDNLYTNIGVKPVGTNVELLINPNDPNEFLTKERWNGVNIVMLAMGILFLLVSLPVFIYFLTSNPLIA